MTQPSMVPVTSLTSLAPSTAPLKMQRFKKQAQRVLTVSVALLAFGLAGCGSGTDKVPDVPPAEPSDAELLATPVPEHHELPCGIQVSSNKPTKILLNGNDAGMTPKDIEDLKAGVYEVTFLDEENGNVTMTVELAPGEYKRVHHAPSPNASDAKVSQ